MVDEDHKLEFFFYRLQKVGHLFESKLTSLPFSAEASPRSNFERRNKRGRRSWLSRELLDG